MTAEYKRLGRIQTQHFGVDQKTAADEVVVLKLDSGEIASWSGGEREMSLGKPAAARVLTTFFNATHSSQSVR